MIRNKSTGESYFYKPSQAQESAARMLRDLRAAEAEKQASKESKPDYHRVFSQMIANNVRLIKNMSRRLDEEDEPKHHSYIDTVDRQKYININRLSNSHLAVMLASLSREEQLGHLKGQLIANESRRANSFKKQPLVRKYLKQLGAHQSKETPQRVLRRYRPARGQREQWRLNHDMS